MQEIGRIIVATCPDVVLLQEVTTPLLRLLQSSEWMTQYYATPPTPSRERYYTLILTKSRPRCVTQVAAVESVMGRDVKVAETMHQSAACAFGSVHLESPVGPGHSSGTRKLQAKQMFDVLNACSSKNAFVAGDTNWIPVDGDMPIPVGWADVWSVLHPDEDGYTFDYQANALIQDGPFRSRLDRLFFRSPDFTPVSAEIVGTTPLTLLMINTRISVSTRISCQRCHSVNTIVDADKWCDVPAWARTAGTRASQRPLWSTGHICATCLA